MSETEPSHRLFVVKSEELLNLTKLNLARLNLLQEKALRDLKAGSLIPEALNVGKALASTISDQLWISAMISEGLSEDLVLKIWNTKDNDSSNLKQNIQNEMDTERDSS